MPPPVASQPRSGFGPFHGRGSIRRRGEGVRPAARLRPGPGRHFDVFPRARVHKVDGRLQFFLPACEAITGDSFVRSVVRDGFCISLAETLPHAAICIRPPALSAIFRQHILAEIQLLLKKGTIKRVRDHPLLCLSLILSSQALRELTGDIEL